MLQNQTNNYYIMKQILFKRSLILLAILWGSVGISNSQTSVNINYFFDSTWTVSCPTPTVIDFHSYGTALGYDPATDSIDIYISFGDGSDTTFTVPIGSIADFSFWLQHTYSLAGTYMTNMIATAPDGASDTLTHGPIYILDDCATIIGVTYMDNNSNCIFDAGDDTLKYHPIEIIEASTGILLEQTWTNNLGMYSATVPSGVNLEVHATAVPGATLNCPSSGMYSFNIPTGSISSYDFAYSCDTAHFDLSTFVSGAGFAPGWFGYMYVSAGNLSCQPQSGTITLTLDPLVSYVSTHAGTAPSTVASNVLTWNTPSMSVSSVYSGWFSQFYAWIQITTDTNATIGDTVCHTISIAPTAGDIDITNNQFSYCMPVLASFDPNMKEVTPKGMNTSGDVDPGTTFTYTVHFQNTGNYPATNVYVLDTISAHLDLSTMEIVAASHEMDVLDLGSGIFKFQFNNINLIDSVSNEPESHGHVTYRIKTLNGLPIGTEIENTAHIFFDYNDAVVTNTTLNTIAVVSSITEKTEHKANLYPNPAQNILNVEFESAVQGKLAIRDLSGRLISSIRINGSRTTIDAAPLAKGIYSLDLNGSFVGKFIVN